MSSKETKAEARHRAETEDMVPPKDKADAVGQAFDGKTQSAGKKTDKEHGDKNNAHSVRTA
jgi:hypothetical protein